MALSKIDLEYLARVIQDNPGVVALFESLQGIPTQVASGQLVEIADSGAINTEFTIPHTLTDADGNERVPVGIIVVGQSIAGSLYDGTTPDTGTDAYRKMSAANVALKLWVF
jgi:hypothetical protein